MSSRSLNPSPDSPMTVSQAYPPPSPLFASFIPPFSPCSFSFIFTSPKRRAPKVASNNNNNNKNNNNNNKSKNNNNNNDNNNNKNNNNNNNKSKNNNDNNNNNSDDGDCLKQNKQSATVRSKMLSEARCSTYINFR